MCNCTIQHKLKGDNQLIKFKKISMLLIAAMLLTSIIGCASGNNNSNNTDGSTTDNGSAGVQEQVELRFGWWGSQIVHDKTLEVIAKFEELHPNIKIKPEFSGWGGYWEKLSTQVAGDNAPDILKMSILYIKEYAERGVLLDLQPYAGKEINTADLDGNVLENQATVNGKLSGIPYADNASIMFYNKEMYAQAGVEPPANGITWDEYFAKAKEMKGKLGDKVYGAFDMSANLEGFMYYLFSKGDKLYEDGKLGYDDENLRSWLTMWDNARKEGIIPPATNTANYILAGGDPSKDALMKGDVPVFGPTWTGVYPAYAGVLGDKLEITTFPRDEHTGSVLQTAMFFSASAKTKHPKEAAMFIDFYVSSIESADILKTTMGIPQNKKVQEHLAPEFSEGDKKMQSMLEHVRSIDPAWYDAGPKGAGEVSKLFIESVQKQQFGQASIEDVVADFRKEASKIIEKHE